MRLIDGDELLSIVRHMTVVDKSVMHRILIQMPTVDAVEVVRCRDCKNAQHDTIFREYWCRGLEVYPDGYCSGGVRKEGEVHDTK